MDGNDWLAERYQAERPHLRAVAYRLLGSFSEADDAIQEAWLRLSRSDAHAVENLGGWFTTAVARVALNMLRARKAKREEPLDTRLPDPVVSPYEGTDPEQEALTADAVGLAMLVVLDTLAPAERLALVLHDSFSVPFEEISAITGRSPAAARQLASRARRRVEGQPVPDASLTRQREVVDAFSAAAQRGDFEALVQVLDPDIVLRLDAGTESTESVVLRGARAVAERARIFSRLTPYARPALVNGALGAVVVLEGRPYAVMAFTVVGGSIVEVDILSDPQRLDGLGLAEFSD